MKRALENLDLAVFGIACVTLVWVVVDGFGTGKKASRGAISRAETVSAAMTAAAELDDYDLSEAAALLARASAKESAIVARWNTALPSRPQAPGLFYHQGALADLRAGVDTVLRFLPPQQLTALADLGAITLTWAISERSTLPAASFEVSRAVAGGPFSKVATIDAAERQWIDRNVEPGVEYGYTVAANSTDPVLIGAGKASSPPSKPISVIAKRDYELIPKTWEAERLTLRVMVKKFVRDTWHEKEFDVKAGEPVGREDAGSGIDYRTNCTVLAIDTASETIRQERDEVDLTPAGKVRIVDGKPVIRRVEHVRTLPVMTMRFTNEVGGVESLVLRHPDATLTR